MIHRTLYAKANDGSIRVWEIGFEDDVIVINHGTLGGVIQHKTEEVEAGKAGRDRFDQIVSRMNSRVNKKIDAGYTESLENARSNKRTNSIGMLKPMLAITLDKIKKANYRGAIVQHKYDGNRCLVTNQDGRIIAYSRNGKPMKNLEHILKDIHIPEGMTIDGEIYCHGFPLQVICSWIKRKQEATEKLKYHVYDVIHRNTYSYRLSMLHRLGLINASSVVPSTIVNSFEEVQSEFRKSRNEGYEGLIVRLEEYGYEDGKRSKGLIKVKEWIDDEFLVTDIHQSVDGWGILTCHMRTGKTFTVSAPGNMHDKRYVLENKNDFIGKKVRVEYAQLTKDGIPFHPVATMWRHKESE